MKAENPKPKEIRNKKSKFSDQNQPPKNIKTSTTTTTSNSFSSSSSSSSKLKSASSWGSHIVKGFSGDRKSKLQTSSSSMSGNNNRVNPNKVKRGGLSCSVVTTTQVHPHALHTTTTTTNNNSIINTKLSTSSSQDLFIEIENLRGFLKEFKLREVQLQGELSECRKKFEAKKNEVESLATKVQLLETEKLSFNQQILYDSRNEIEICRGDKSKNLVMENVQLRRLNKELQLQKRSLGSNVVLLESQLSNLAKVPESEIMGKIKAEASLLRRTNEDLSKQVEGLQMSRLNEVEELAYLRWVNAQLRNELQSPCVCPASEVETSAHAYEASPLVGFHQASRECEQDHNSSNAEKLSAVKKLYRWPVNNEDLSSLEENNSVGRRHSISGLKCCDDNLMMYTRRQSDGFMCSKEAQCRGDSDDDAQHYQKQDADKFLVPTEVEKRALRIPNPPPKPSSANSNEAKEARNGQTQVAPPPPPPPPPPLPPPHKFLPGSNVGAVQRAPQVVEFYHSLMKRDSRRDSSGGAVCESPNLSSARSNMIGEIENRSSYLLAIKADVETQGEFVNSLIREVNNAVYQNIDDVVAFVKWLDDELCFLVDERAVLKHFDWPEKKADTLREAAFGYKDLKKLELEVAYYHDDPQLPCDIALRKMVSLSEKIERAIYNIFRTRESLMRSCKEFQIPIDWMLDGGIISKVKLGSVKLAKKYMNRVAIELQSRSSLEKDVAMDYMLLQGVRFAFRIHQFAGGFDAETMQAFEELRKLAHALDKR